MTVGLSPFVTVNGLKRTMAEVGRSSAWLLQQVRGTDLRSTKNILVLIGANDIGGTPASSTVANTLAIWDHCKAQGIRVFAQTLPPNKGWAPFASNFAAIEARRKEVNAALGQAFQQGRADGLIDLSRLMAAPGDPERLAPAFDSGDHLHPRKDAHGALLTQAFGGPTGPLPPSLVPSPGSPSKDVAPLFLMVGACGIVAYLLTRKRWPLPNWR